MAEGVVARCDPNGDVFLVEKGKLRRFTTPEKYVEYGNPIISRVSCSSLSKMEQGQPI
jgi:hypothetical protein